MKGVECEPVLGSSPLHATTELQWVSWAGTSVVSAWRSLAIMTSNFIPNYCTLSKVICIKHYFHQLVASLLFISTLYCRVVLCYSSLKISTHLTSFLVEGLLVFQAHSNSTSCSRSSFSWNHENLTLSKILSSNFHQLLYLVWNIPECDYVILTYFMCINPTSPCKIFRN